MKTRLAWLLAALVLAAFALSCSGSRPAEVVLPNQRPTIELSTAPQHGDSVFYVVKFTWFAFDPDGEVQSYRYAVDPPMEGDTAWTATKAQEVTLKFRSSTPGKTTPTGIAGTDYHVFAVEALDDRGLASAPTSDAFTSYTVAPQARVTFPSPSRMGSAQTPITLTVQWTGIDPDGPGDKRPARYKFRMVEQSVIQAALGLGSFNPTPLDLQKYFSLDAPGFASWDSVGKDTTGKRYVSLSPGTSYFFAVLAFDEVGAYDPRFDLDRNVLRFRPQIGTPGPKLTVYNDLISTSGYSLDTSPERYGRMSLPSGEPIRFDWKATPQPGTALAGFRWVLDPPNGEIGDETPRENDSQTYRWSPWALAEQSATVGPFTGTDPHYLFVEARDNGGGMSLVTTQINIVQRTSQFLVIDDVQGPVDMDYGPTNPSSFQPYGNFPTEAVLDTLLYAVGGKPYKHRPTGTLSRPGMFAGFDYDTLDYRFRLSQGLPQDLLFRYAAVIIYTTRSDVLAGGTQFNPTLDALRFATFRQLINPLVSYVAHGGKLWLFGDGIFYGLLLSPGDPVAALPKFPPFGSFVSEYMKLNTLYYLGGNGLNPKDYLVGATPYLPAYTTPGRPWPPDTTRVYVRVCDDPRVGPAASRNVARWDGLPCLHWATEFNDWPSGFPTGESGVAFVAWPLDEIETFGPPGSQYAAPALDTLYLYRSVNYIGGGRYTNPDGKPVMCAYEGNDSGPVVWTGMSLWYFDREDLRQLAAKVLGSFGIHSVGDAASFHGPGSAEHIDDGPPAPSGSATASRRPSE